MSMLKKKLLKYRIKLIFCYVKIGILFVFTYLWLFLPGFIVLLLQESILSWIGLIMICFNFRLLSGENFILNKWSNKLESERTELRYIIREEKALSTVGNIKILPFGKH